MRSSELRQRTKMKDAAFTPRNRPSGGPDWLCDTVVTVGPGRLLTGSLGTSKSPRKVASAMVSQNPERNECDRDESYASCPSSEGNAVDYFQESNGVVLMSGQGNR
uniref:Uncharacterized protein n=1 Tax=Haemonchus contortus TaxID=6289 RepID=A0A7I4Z401_HAECO